MLLALKKWDMWRRLQRVNKVIERLFHVSTTPFQRYSEILSTRLPYSSFYFHPLFLNEIYMALGLWEPYLSHVFAPNKGDVVLDAGAHIGYYTLKAAQAVGSKGLVISVEPDPRSFKILHKNVWSNKLQNVILNNYALSSFTGYATFKKSANPLFSSLLKKSQKGDQSLMKMKVKTIDQLCGEIGVKRLDWVKIDVEKDASDVLKGGFEILGRTTKMIIEIGDDETFEVLAKLGYSIRPLYIFPSSCKFGYYYAANRHTWFSLSKNLDKARFGDQ
jgi:FkbM family methyltransferase